MRPAIPAPVGIDGDGNARSVLCGFDTSAAQGEKWAARVDQLVDLYSFGIYKAADGEHDVDPAWEFSAKQSVAQQFPFLAYVVLEPYGAARVDTQVQNAVKRIKGSGAIGVACDHELAKGETGIVALETAADYMDGLEQELGAPCLYYAGESFVDQLEQMAASAGQARLDAVVVRLAKHPLWVADYRGLSLARGAPGLPKGWVDYAIWQLGPAGSSFPWGTRVDFNLFRGTMEDFLSTCCTTGGT